MIIAVDFDGTLCERRYPEIGQPNIPLIKGLKEKQEQGDKFILWTCRSGEHLENAVKWCEGYGLFFDSVNENLPEILELWGNDSRKITADIYIDDRAAAPVAIVVSMFGAVAASGPVRQGGHWHLMQEG